MSRILVTGAAGFIGFHLCRRLLQLGNDVVGLDNLNAYYDVSLKQSRLDQIKAEPAFGFHQADLCDAEELSRLFDAGRFDAVVNLAAQAGVRYSVENPRAYVDSNLVGFVNLLECCRHHSAGHLVFASSSSVYGANTKMPFCVGDRVDRPISLYAATKKANELMAHAYSHLYALPATGLRFFTVYGPWGRPDMALFKFTRAILAGEAIDVYNFGEMQRDFTYIDDIVEGVVRVIGRIPQPSESRDDAKPDRSGSTAPYRLYNIGNNQPVELMHVIECLERELGRQAGRNLLPMQPGDVPATCADIDDLARDVGFRPSTPIDEGIRRFVAWYREFYERGDV